MQAHGSDRFRASGERAILLSPIPKGWVPRTPASGTHAEFPGTAVLWDDRYFEVVAADATPAGGVRYVLEPWRDDQVMRTVEQYDDEAEARRHAEHELVLRQNRNSQAARVAGVVLGHLPTHVQNHLAHELGVSPSRMTIVSCIPAVVLFGSCVYLAAEAAINQQPSPVPLWLFLVAGGLLLDAGVRFNVAMAQDRGIGSLPGMIAYTIYWHLSPRRGQLPSPFIAERGDRLFSLPAADDVALRDSIEMRGPLLSLLSAAEQERLAARYGFEYRRHARPLTWLLLICAAFGVITSVINLRDAATLSAALSLLVAGAIALEQVVRLRALRDGPAGSILGTLVRPFLRDLLEPR